MVFEELAESNNIGRGKFPAIPVKVVLGKDDFYAFGIFTKCLFLVIAIIAVRWLDKAFSETFVNEFI